MIKLLLLAVVPFMTEHRNVTPKTEVSTNFYGSVTGIVDRAYIEEHGGGGCDTNAVDTLSNAAVVTNALTVATTNRVTWLEHSKADKSALDAKRDKDDLAVYKLVKSAFVLHKDGLTDVTLPFIGKDQGKPYQYSHYDWVYPIGETTAFHAIVFSDGQWKLNVADGMEYGYSSASEDALRIEFDNGYVATRSSIMSTAPVDDQQLAAVATGDAQTPANGDLVKYDAANDRFVKATAGTDYVKDISGKMDKVNSASHGFLVADENGNAKPSSLVDEITICKMQLSLQNKADRATTLLGYGITDATPLSMISATNPTFSNAVLAVGLNIDTNSVAVINEIASTFGGFPIEGTATTVGGLLAALAAAVAWLKKNKVGSFSSVGDATATVENGVAKLDDFFTESNSLLTGTIDAEIVEKGTAPDAHLEAPTDEHLKLILADNSVAYDSAKALPYKLTSAIGDRVVATMTLTAASTDITLPAIAANDTTVKDFILDVTNAYAVEGVATDAGINIPRTDFKLVTRDGESLTAVTTVKAGKSAFICFTQKSPVVVDGTTYPCWCVIQLPFGDPS